MNGEAGLNVEIKPFAHHEAEISSFSIWIVKLNVDSFG